MARKKLSAHAESIWRWAAPEIRKKWAREAAAEPNASLAQKLWGPVRKPLLADAKRGAISPLGGVAKLAKETKR
jgi:hypothetical protein